jgi:hypothetical protein
LSDAINRWCTLSQKPEIRAACAERGHEYTIERNVADTLKVLEHLYREKFAPQAVPETVRGGSPKAITNQ